MTCLALVTLALVTLALVTLGGCVLNRAGTGLEASVDSGGTGGAGGGDDACGNGVVEFGEECDGENFAGRSCMSFGHQPGILRCTSSCQIELDDCGPAGGIDEALTLVAELKVAAQHVSEDLFEFPLLVKLPLKSFDDASLLRFGAGPQDLYPHEVAAVQTNPPLAWLWIKLPRVARDEDTVVNVYRSEKVLAPLLRAEWMKKVWAGKYQVVLHLDEDPVQPGFNGKHKDSSNNGHDAVRNGNLGTLGLVAGAQNFALGDFLTLGNSEAINLGTTSCAVSAWVRSANMTPSTLLSKHVPNGELAGSKMVGLVGNTLGVQHGAVGGVVVASTELANSEWHHVAWVQRYSTSLKEAYWSLYVDGVKQNAITAGAKPMKVLPDNPSQLVRVAAGVVGSSYPAGLMGKVDEIRVAKLELTPAWLEAEYLNQKDPASFVGVRWVEEPGRVVEPKP